MSEVRERLRKRLETFEASPAGYGAKLRLDFAEIIWRNLELKPWSQRQLAAKARLADSVVSNLIHGNKNCTLDTVGKVIHALGTEAALLETPPSAKSLPDGTFLFHGGTGDAVPFSIKDYTSVQTSTYKIKIAGS